MEESMNHFELVNSGGLVISDTPEDLWNRMYMYFKWCNDNPKRFKRVVTTGKEAGKEFTEVRERPYTIKGLCLHCGILEEYLRDLRQSTATDSPYYIVVSKALYIIHTQVSENALLGEFSPTFSKAMLGIEKDDIPEAAIRVEVVHGLPELSSSENEILEKLESENRLFEKN